MAGHKCMVVCLMCFDLRLFSKFHFHGLGLYMHKAMSRLYKITIFYNWSTLYIRTRTRKYMYLYPIKLCNIHMYALTRMNMSTWLCVRCFFFSFCFSPVLSSNPHALTHCSAQWMRWCFSFYDTLIYFVHKNQELYIVHVCTSSAYQY